MIVLRRTLNITYIITFILSVLLLYSLLVGTPIVRQVEAEVGRPITCDEAYAEHREIDLYFFENYRNQGHIIYLSNMLFPGWLILVGLLTIFFSAVLLKVERRLRLYWPLVIVTILTLLPVLMQGRFIYIIACATE